MDDELKAKLLLFFQQFRQSLYHENHGAPCVHSDNPWPRGTWFDAQSAEILHELIGKQGETSVSRE